jgi:hypothetical protein
MVTLLSKPQAKISQFLTHLERDKHTHTHTQRDKDPNEREESQREREREETVGSVVGQSVGR